jgi:hypothetical protein
VVSRLLYWAKSDRYIFRLHAGLRQHRIQSYLIVDTPFIILLVFRVESFLCVNLILDYKSRSINWYSHRWGWRCLICLGIQRLERVWTWQRTATNIITVRYLSVYVLIKVAWKPLMFRYSVLVMLCLMIYTQRIPCSLSYFALIYFLWRNYLRRDWALFVKQVLFRLLSVNEKVSSAGWEHSESLFLERRRFWLGLYHLHDVI